jgi:hypothetical protein
MVRAVWGSMTADVRLLHETETVNTVQEVKLLHSPLPLGSQHEWGFPHKDIFLFTYLLDIPP